MEEIEKLKQQINSENTSMVIGLEMDLAKLVLEKAKQLEKETERKPVPLYSDTFPYQLTGYKFVKVN